MSDLRRELGQWGETVAAEYLVGQGYSLVARNWRCARGEIDLILQKEGVWVFVEVKTRRGQGAGLPEEGVTPRKLQKIGALVQMYLEAQGLEEVEWQVDLVAVEVDRQGKLRRCEHIPNVVLGW